jgi:hypothetical protein
LLSIAVAPAASAVALYRVDFSSPTHTVGQPPALADGLLPSRTPDAINFGSPDVVAPRSGMTSQSIELGVPANATTALEQLHFDTPFFQSRYSIEFDVVVEAVLSGSSFSDGFSVHFDAASVRALRFQTDGTIRAFEADGSSPVVDHYAIGQLIHVKAQVSAVTNLWSLFLDGALVHQTPAPSTSLNSIRMTVADPDRTGATVLVDNIEIVVAPEPSTALLVGFGLVALAVRRRR